MDLSELEESWFVFTTQGEMTLADVVGECQDGAWVPLLIIRTDKGVIVPYFPLQDVAISFAKRNIPKDQLWGTTGLTRADVQKLLTEWIEARGWKLEKMDFPKRIGDRGNLDVEVFFYTQKPEIFKMQGRQGDIIRAIR